MPTDPLDKQLVEAVLSRPRRAKADIEEAKLAGLRPRRAPVAVAEPDDEEDDDDDEDLELAAVGQAEAEPEGEVSVEVVAEDAVDASAARLPAEGPTKLDPKEVEEPTPEDLEAISADMIGIDDPVRMYLKEIGKVALLTAEEEVVMAQRLVRLLCRRCKRPGPPPDTLLRESGLDPDVYHDQLFLEAVGCDECGGTGFLGRTAVAELLDMSDRIRQLILERRPTGEIKQAAREEGMTFLRDSALEKVFAGLTTLREINKVAFVA